MAWKLISLRLSACCQDRLAWRVIKLAILTPPGFENWITDTKTEGPNFSNTSDTTHVWIVLPILEAQKSKFLKCRALNSFIKNQL